MNRFRGAFHILNELTFRRAPKRGKTKQANILFIVPWFHTNMIPMVTSLKDAGHQVAVIVETKSVIEKYDILIPIPIDNFNEWTEFKNKLPYDQPDLIIIRSHSAKAIKLSKSASNGIATVIEYNQKPLRRKKGLKYLIKDIKRLRARQLKGLPLRSITPVDHVSSIQKRLPKKLLTTKFNFPIDTLAFQSSVHPNSARELVVFQVGKLTQPRKRHDWTINALLSSGIKCRLEIYGAGIEDLKFKRPSALKDTTRSESYYYRLLEKVDEANKSGRLKVHVHTNVDYDILKREHARADVSVLPSSEEEYGITVLEAMSRGCAVITSDVTGAAHNLPNEKGVMIFKSEDFKDYELKLHKILIENETRNTIQKQCRHTAEEEHNYAQFVDFIESLIRR